MGIFKWFNDLSMRVKLVGIVAAQLVVVGIAFMWMFNSEVSTAAREDSISQARRVVDMAESIRHGMAEKWKSGVFEQEEVSAWAKEGELSRVLATVPIVAAWEAVMMKAKEGGYEFKTPRVGARNSSNEPDEFERRALEKLTSGGINEYSEFDETKNVVRYFRPIKLSQECLMCHGDPKDSQEIWGNSDGLDGTGHKMENLAVGDLHGAYEVIQSLDAADQRAQAATMKGLALVGGFILGSCLLLIWILNRSLLRPLQAAGQAFQRLLNGDLRQEIEVKSKDEIGQLQGGINAMVKQLRTMIENMRCNSLELGQVSSGLETTAGSVEKAALATTSRSQTVSAAAEEMSQALIAMRGSLTEVSTKVQAVAAASTQVMSNAESVALNTNESAKIAKNAEDLAAQGGVQIRELENAAEGIGDIVDVIKDIAEQTNLLALNATIEASRAGEAGKGFAVVASEVKQLARETADATSEIRRRIESIQGISGQVVNAMHEIELVVRNVSKCTDEASAAVAEQRTTIASVAEQLEEAATLTASVGRNVDDTVAAAQEVSQSIHEVNSIAETTSREVETTKTAGVNVKRVSESFSEQLATFAV
ncbi:MAG: methyl-accepting chemotaxis protein [Planctomycetales bacterium]|nr:methyl-accepting chemotaxis protein [Planctomycetales bacterium]